MNDTVLRLLADALQLPETDRAALAASLIDSLEETTDDDAEAAWGAEIRQRLAEIHLDEVKLLSFEEAQGRLFGKHDGMPGT